MTESNLYKFELHAFPLLNLCNKHVTTVVLQISVHDFVSLMEVESRQ